VVEAKIEVEDNQEVAQAPYRIPEPKRDVVNAMIDELLQHDIISKSTSEYASPVVLIKKKNGGDRLCVDYRRLNKLIKFITFTRSETIQILFYVGFEQRILSDRSIT